jgi:hypothetical protein
MTNNKKKKVQTTEDAKVKGFLDMIAPSVIQFYTDHYICSKNRPDLTPARPSRLPATDRSWQGEPPAIISTTGRFSPCNFVISPMCVILGNRYLVTAMGNFSISLAHIGLIPFLFAANGNPPIPSNRLPSFFSIAPPYAATTFTIVLDMLIAACAA